MAEFIHFVIQYERKMKYDEMNGVCFSLISLILLKRNWLFFKSQIEEKNMVMIIYF